MRTGWNLAAELNPSAIAFVESAEDVAETVRFAAADGLRVAGQGTGHGAAPLAPLDDTILIRTTGMRGVEVDPDAQTARVEAGVLSVELGEAANAHGLCFLPGSSPDVGVVGYTLGGGLSWLGRKHGFACNHVRAIELVTADGEPRSGRRRDRARPLLGDARRWGRLRDRHRAPGRPRAGRRGLREAC